MITANQGTGQPTAFARYVHIMMELRAANAPLVPGVGKGSNYQPIEDDFLMKHYKTQGMAWCARKLGRGEKSVAVRAQRIGAAPKGRRWART